MALIQNGIYWDDLTPDAQERLKIHENGNNDISPLAWLEYEINLEECKHEGRINRLDIFYYEEDEMYFVVDLQEDEIEDSFTSLEDAKNYCRNQ